MTMLRLPVLNTRTSKKYAAETISAIRRVALLTPLPAIGGATVKRFAVV
jgi:hypothetical protein